MLETKKVWHILDVLNWTSDYLSEKSIENARLNAERLLAHALKMDRVNLYLNSDRPLTGDELNRFKGYLKRRLQNEPLQYILGEAEFMSLPFQVKPGVLIPRPETEILVETVLEKCKEKFHSEKIINILDIGTGSGCIAISLAKYLKQSRITALDKSAEAINVAFSNARINEVSAQIQFLTIDLMKIVNSDKLSGRYDVLVSNPPYISAAELENLPKEIKQFEPEIALTDNKDGLDLFREIAQIASMLLKPSGFIAVEVGLGQAERVKNIFSTNGFSNVYIHKDLNGIERALLCESKSLL